MSVGTCNKSFQTVQEADLVIGEQSQPSTGQGMEIRECAILNKPLIVVAKEGSKVSGLVKAMHVLNTFTKNELNQLNLMRAWPWGQAQGNLI